MRVINLTREYVNDIGNDSAVAIGKFDGIHLGHEKLISELLECKKKGLTTIIFTFDGSVSAYFSGEEPRYLTTRSEQIEELSRLGVDVCALYPVNKESVSVKSEDFVREILCEKLKAKMIIAGYDCSFGDKGSGNIELLKKMGPELSFETKSIDKIVEKETGREISSTYVRELVIAGDMVHANKLLGKNYSITGTVRHGRKLGRTLNMPTINLIPENEKLLPPFGVYFSKARIDGREYKGITNIGRKPTVNDTKELTVETYLYDFDKEVYGFKVTVELLEFKRPEMKFSSIEELKSQMKKDIDAGAVY